MAQSPSSSIKRPLSWTYVAVWLILASAAAAYLAALFLRPDLLALSFDSDPVTAQESSDGQRAASMALADVNALRHVVGDVQTEVDDLKDSMAAQIARGNVVAGRLAALEERAAAMVSDTTVPKSQPIAEPRNALKNDEAHAQGRIDPQSAT